MPNIREEVEKILEYVYSCDVRSDKQDKDKVIKQAIDQILQAVEEMLPIRLDMWFPCTGNNNERVFYKEGFNICLAQIRRIIDEK